MKYIGHTKSELIDKIECLEHNCKVKDENFELQVKISTKMVNDLETEIAQLKQINENIRQESVHKKVYELLEQENARLRELLKE